MAYVPYVTEDTGRGERTSDIFSRLLRDRIIFIGTPINEEIANLLIAQLIFLQADDPKKDINIYINSPGGNTTSGLAVYDTMNYLKCDINTYCVGQATSTSCLLLCAGTKGKRYALPHSQIMLHQPSGQVTGTSVDIGIQAKEVIKQKRSCAKILAHHTGQPLEKVIEDADRDFYMSPDEAQKYGIIDTIMTPTK